MENSEDLPQIKQFVRFLESDKLPYILCSIVLDKDGILFTIEIEYQNDLSFQKRCAQVLSRVFILKYIITEIWAL